jgi:glycosyltransferase involved in cell wall biosynthesis
MHVLINDFIGGYVTRGIPQFVGSLEIGLAEAGHRVSVVRAPRWFEHLPRPIAHAVAVAVEQAFVPIYGRAIGAEVVIYPYNSMAALDLRSGRGRIVVHDLELLSRAPASLNRLYAEWCYRAIRRRRHPIFTVSDSAKQSLAQCPFFEGSAIHVLPNAFYGFERSLRTVGPVTTRPRTALLCTGHTPNKELSRVASSLLPLILGRDVSVHVVGLHSAKGRGELSALREAAERGRLVIHDRLPDPELARLYAESTFVWVHSRSEGFGRPIVEGRLAGRPVICSDIPPFRALADRMVRHYTDADSFLDAIAWALEVRAENVPYDGFDYRAEFRAAIERLTCAS